jgi:hypothetical protein
MTPSRRQRRLDDHLGRLSEGDNEGLDQLRQLGKRDSQPRGYNGFAVALRNQRHANDAFDNFDIGHLVERKFPVRPCQ